MSQKLGELSPKRGGELRSISISDLGDRSHCLHWLLAVWLVSHRVYLNDSLPSISVCHFAYLRGYAAVLIKLGSRSERRLVD